jgi:ethanolamine utilization protein EutQ (cupin superfamily)
MKLELSLSDAKALVEQLSVNGKNEELCEKISRQVVREQIKRDISELKSICETMELFISRYSYQDGTTLVYEVVAYRNDEEDCYLFEYVTLEDARKNFYGFMEANSDLKNTALRLVAYNDVTGERIAYTTLKGKVFK